MWSFIYLYSLESLKLYLKDNLVQALIRMITILELTRIMYLSKINLVHILVQLGL